MSESSECRFCGKMEFLRELRVVEEARKMEPGSLIQIIRTCLPYSLVAEDDSACGECFVNILRMYGIRKRFENIDTWRKENPSEPVPETLIQRQIDFQCIHCAKGYKTPKGLKNHMKKSHQPCCKQAHCLEEHGCGNDYCGEEKNRSRQSAAIIENNNATGTSIVTNTNDPDISQQQDDGSNDNIFLDVIDGGTDTEQSAPNNTGENVLENNIPLERRRRNAVKRTAKALGNNRKRRRQTSTVSSVEPAGDAQISSASNNPHNHEELPHDSDVPSSQRSVPRVRVICSGGHTRHGAEVFYSENDTLLVRPNDTVYRCKRG